MERRHFLKLAFGFAAGAAAFAASARAAPLAPRALTEDGRLPPSNEEARPAVTTGEEVEHLKPSLGLAQAALGLAQTALGLAPPPLAPQALGLAPSLLAPPLLVSRVCR